MTTILALVEEVGFQSLGPRRLNKETRRCTLKVFVDPWESAFNDISHLEEGMEICDKRAGGSGCRIC
jgi:hypothetical protein